MHMHMVNHDHERELRICMQLHSQIYINTSNFFKKKKHKQTNRIKLNVE
jgi:hypothetical protein